MPENGPLIKVRPADQYIHRTDWSHEWYMYRQVKRAMALADAGHLFACQIKNLNLLYTTTIHYRLLTGSNRVGIDADATCFQIIQRRRFADISSEGGRLLHLPVSRCDPA